MKTRASDDEKRWPSLLLVGVEEGELVAEVRVEVREEVLWAEVEVAEALEEALDAELEEEEAALEVLLALPLVLERAEVASVEPVVEALPVPL